MCNAVFLDSLMIGYQRRRHDAYIDLQGSTGVNMCTPLVLEVEPEIDANQVSFYGGRGESATFGA